MNRSVLGLLKNLSIRTFILIPAVGMAVVAMAVGVIGLGQISRVSDDVQSLYQGTYLPARDLGLIREEVWTARWAYAKSLLANDPASQAEYQAAFDEQSTLVDTTTQDLLSRPIPPAEQAAVWAFASSWQTYLDLRRNAHALEAAGDAAGVQAYANGVLNPQITTALAYLDTASGLSASSATAALQQVDDLKRNARLWVLLTLLSGGALATSLALLVARSITAAQIQVSVHQASQDALTGLPNRAQFTYLLNQRLAEAQTGDGRERIAVVLLDLDRFKEINDTLGHHYGDRLLQQIGPRIQEVLRAGEVMARIGGDEFAFLVSFTEPGSTEPGSTEPGESALQQHEAVARRVIAALHEPFLIDEIALAVEASAGIAAFPEHGDTGDQLLQFADTAMYLAKANHEEVVVYDRGLDVNDPRKLALLSQLRKAIYRDELVLHYQPLIDIRSNRVRGVEALIRWQHPTEGLLPPSDFVALAEGSGFIHELTRHVLRVSCRQAKLWQEAGTPLVVSVNVSARCLLDTTLPGAVQSVLTELDLPPDLLKLEITESAIIADPARAQSVIQRLQALGVALSIDDFGTGYTSLAYLRDLPVHELKIDRTFVSRMLFDPKDAIIVRTAVELATRLGLESVAEGIENPEILSALAELGCTTAQGYHLGRPMAAAAFDHWLAGRPGRIAAQRRPRSARDRYLALK